MKRINYIPVAFFAMLIPLLTCCSDGEMLLESVSDGDTPSEGGVDGGFKWVLSKDLATRSSFVRNFGVGYSYDAVKGRFCNWEDIRCQVISRSELQKYETENNVQYSHTYESNQIAYSSQYAYSLRDYVANVTITTKEEIDLGLYKGEKRTKQYVLENGVQEKIYYKHIETNVLGRQYIEDDNIRTLVDEGEFQLYTNSFVNAVFHIADTKKDNFAVVDSFINVYGTHVITDAALGGKIAVEIQNDMWRYSDNAANEEWSEKEFLNMIADKEKLRQNSAAFTLIDNCKIDITAVGGDQSSISSILGERKYDGSRGNINLDAISTWRKSLVYNPNNEFASTVELVDMKVTPIWFFIEPLDMEVAERVKAAVQQDAAALQKLLGDNNFFSTSFKVKYDNLDCEYRQETNKWQQCYVKNPDVVNIVSNGRYVATVCNETINNQKFTVAYPIYEGKINLACGLGIAADGNAYRVRWINDNVYLLQLDKSEVPQTSVFYANAGGLSFVKREDIIYETSQAFPYVEVSGGVLPNGGYSSEVYPVKKSGKDFLCSAPSNLSKPLISWTYNNGKNAWLRDNTYTYIYNPNELR